MSIGSISTSTISSIMQNTVARLQSQLSTASSESSTGTLADIGLTLGSDSGQDVAMHQQMADIAAISASNAVVTSQQSTASNALNSLQSAASTMLTNVIGAASSPAGSTGALAIQQDAAGALSSFTSMANAEVGGQFVFGGINTSVAPMATFAGGAVQAAVDTAFQSTFGMPLTSASVNTITGSQMTGFLNNQFAALFTGSSWTSNWSSASATPVTNRIGVNETVATSISANQPPLQQSLQQMAQGLSMLSEFGGLNLNSEAYQALTSAAQSALTGANSGMIAANAALGAMQNQVTQSNSAITLQQNVLTAQINSKEAVSPYDVVTQVSHLSTQLQTAYSLTAQIHKLSLINFL